MPHTDTIPVSASIASTGPGIRYVGKDWAYGYTGQINATSGTNASLFDFTSGMGFFLAKFQQTIDYTLVNNNQKIGFIIKFNGIIVAKNIDIYSTAGEANRALLGLSFLIPPFTRVETEGFTDDTNDIPFTHILTGRVYGEA